MISPYNPSVAPLIHIAAYEGLHEITALLTVHAMTLERVPPPPKKSLDIVSCTAV